MSSMIPLRLTQRDKESYLNPELATQLARGTLSSRLPLERWHYRQAATATLHLCGAWAELTPTLQLTHLIY